MMDLAKQASGVHDTSFRCFIKCDVDVRKELYVKAASPRSTTMFREIVERLTNELTALVPFTTKIKVVALSM